MKHKFTLALKFVGVFIALQNSPCVLQAMFSDEMAQWCSGGLATELAVISGGVAVAYAGYRIEYTVRAKEQQERNRLAYSGDLGVFILYLRPLVRHWEVLDVEGLKKLVSAGKPGKLKQAEMIAKELTAEEHDKNISLG